MQNFYSSSKKPKIHFLSANFARVRDCIPNTKKMNGIKQFYFPYTSSKFFSIAGAMQKNFSSSKKNKLCFLLAHFLRVRDRTACLSSFLLACCLQAKKASSDSPTPICKNNVSRERYVVFADWGNAQKKQNIHVLNIKNKSYLCLHIFN